MTILEAEWFAFCLYSKSLIPQSQIRAVSEANVALLLQEEHEDFRARGNHICHLTAGGRPMTGMMTAVFQLVGLYLADPQNHSH